MLWLFYASLKSESDAFLLITVNSVGCVIETIYIGLYLAYAPKQARVRTYSIVREERPECILIVGDWMQMPTLRLLILLNFGGYCSILLLSHFLAKDRRGSNLLGGFALRPPLQSSLLL